MGATIGAADATTEAATIADAATTKGAAAAKMSAAGATNAAENGMNTAGKGKGSHENVWWCHRLCYTEVAPCTAHGMMKLLSRVFISLR